ncbi:MAG: PIN domain-containing protein [Allosphingosinicella sp.]
MIFIDTDVAIALRDNDGETKDRLAEIGRVPVISVVTRIELENGVNSESGAVNHRRRRLDRLLETIMVELFTPADILAYGAIVDDLGYDRRTTLDRLIAAQAISRDARLITRNRRDFDRIEGLRLEVWPSP